MKTFVLALIRASAPAFAGAPQSYPLKCRGGKIETFNFEFAPTTANLGFKKAAKAAPADLKPGECSWKDRAIAPSEPSMNEQHPAPPKNMCGPTTIRFG